MTPRRSLLDLVTLMAILVGVTACSSAPGRSGAQPDASVPDVPVTTAVSSDEPTTSVGIPAIGSPTRTATCTMNEPVDQVVEIDSAAFGSTDRVSVHFTACTLDQAMPSPIIYLLHGANADETQWPDVDIFTAADAAVANGTLPPSILVAPDAAPAYECRDCIDALHEHLIDEIEPAIDRIAPVDATRRAIGGISRGGGLALQIAGFAPDEFAAVGAHSSVDAPDSALLALAAAGLPVRFDVGDSDGLRHESMTMAADINANGGRAELVVGTGRHDRDYWTSQADAYIAFYADHLG